MMSRKQRIREFERHPNMVKLYLRAGQHYRENHFKQKNRQYFHNIYEWFVFSLFCESINEFRIRFGPNLFNGGVDCKEFLENYFHIKL